MAVSGFLSSSFFPSCSLSFSLSYVFCSLVHACWDNDPSRRPSFAQILKHLHNIQQDVQQMMTTNVVVTPLRQPSDYINTYSSTISYQGRVYMFGGIDSAGRRTNSLFCFSITANTCNLITCFGTIPPPVSHHIAVSWRNKMVVFGGLGGVGTGTVLNDVWILDLDTFLWTNVAAGAVGADSARNFPPPMIPNTATLQGDTLVLFGGKTADQQFVRKVYSFLLETHSWTCLTDTPSNNSNNNNSHSEKQHQQQ